MQTVKSKKRHSCWDEREIPASFWKLTNAEFLWPQYRSLYQQGPNHKTKEKVPNWEQFRTLFNTTILPPKESFWPKQDNFLLPLTFSSLFPDFIFPNVAFFPLSVKENYWKGNALMFIASGEQVKQGRGRKFLSTQIYGSLEGMLTKRSVRHMNPAAVTGPRMSSLPHHMSPLQGCEERQNNSSFESLLSYLGQLSKNDWKWFSARCSSTFPFLQACCVDTMSTWCNNSPWGTLLSQTCGQPWWFTLMLLHFHVLLTPCLWLLYMLIWVTKT